MHARIPNAAATTLTFLLLQVQLWIHWQAILLFLKNVKVYEVPHPNYTLLGSQNLRWAPPFYSSSKPNLASKLPLMIGRLELAATRLFAVHPTPPPAPIVVRTPLSHDHPLVRYCRLDAFQCF